MSEQPASGLAVVVLAAGKGTRMRSELPKVLHTVLGRTVLDWVLAHVAPLSADRTIVVVGHEADTVTASLPADVTIALQEQQLGSGDALGAALPALDGFDGDVLVVNGDGALFTTATMTAVASEHAGHGAWASALAIDSLEDLPYGRVIADPDGGLLRIVEARDATPAELAVRALNAGVYCFDASALRAAVPLLTPHNSQGELYITDLLGIIREAGRATRAVIAGAPDELLGINTRADLADVEGILQGRIARDHMEAGVTMSLPATTLIEPTVHIEPGARIEPGCLLRGATTVAAGAVIGPYTTLVDTVVEAGAVVAQSVCIEARIGPRANVGPYAYLRPGAQLSEDSKVGTFVELKQTLLGARSKVPHLSYVGDATVGPDSNIGAGNITANYRPELGRGKQPTRIGAGVRTGSDNVFVAPVTIGDGAFTGAGSIIVQDVPAGALAIARARQVNLQDYAQRLAQPAPDQEQPAGDSANGPDATAASSIVSPSAADPHG